MLKLEPFYEGKNFSVYHTDKDLFLLTLLSDEDMNDTVEWKPGHKVPPNCIDFEGAFYVKNSDETPNHIQFVESVNEDEWTTIPAVLKSELAFRVQEIPMVFSLSLGSFVVEKSKIYEQLTESEDESFNYAKPSFLEDLDNWGITPSYLEITRSGKYCRGGIKGEVPTYLTKGYFKYANVRVDIEPIKQKINPEVPLFRNPSDNSMCWIIDKRKELFWTAAATISLTPEEVRESFGTITNQPFEVKLNVERQDSLLIELNVIEEVESEQPVPIQPWYGIEYALCWRDQQNNVLVSNIKFKKMHFFEEHSVLIGSLANLAEFMEKFKLVKLNKTLLAGRHWLRLHYIEKGELKALPGRYARTEYTYPSKSMLETKRKERSSLLAQLQYVLPGDCLEWTEEQLLEYDQLLKSGEYNSERMIRIGTYQYSPDSHEMNNHHMKAGGTTKEFVSRPVLKRVRPTRVVLYRVVDLLDILDCAAKTSLPVQTSGFMHTMYMLADKGFPREYMQEILDKVFNPETNKCITSGLPHKSYVESTVLGFSGLGISKEVILEVFGTYLDLPRTNQLLAMCKNV